MKIYIHIISENITDNKSFNKFHDIYKKDNVQRAKSHPQKNINSIKNIPSFFFLYE